MEEDAIEDAGSSRTGPSDDTLLAAFAKINKRRREEVGRQRRNTALKKSVAESFSEAERTAATVDLFSCVRIRSKRQLCSEENTDASLRLRPSFFEIGNTTEWANKQESENITDTSSMMVTDISVSPASSPTTPIMQTELDFPMHTDNQSSTLDDVLTPLGNSDTDCDHQPQGEQDVSFALDVRFYRFCGVLVGFSPGSGNRIHPGNGIRVM